MAAGGEPGGEPSSSSMTKASGGKACAASPPGAMTNENATGGGTRTASPPGVSDSSSAAPTSDSPSASVVALTIPILESIIGRELSELGTSDCRIASDRGLSDLWIRHRFDKTYRLVRANREAFRKFFLNENDNKVLLESTVRLKTVTMFKFGDVGPPKQHNLYTIYFALQA